MSNDTAMFESFNDDLDLDLEDAAEIDPALDGEEETGSPEELIFGGADMVYEERAIPAITALIFYETEDNKNAMEAVGRDRRMSRASINMHEGGVPAAIEYLKSSPHAQSACRRIARRRRSIAARSRRTRPALRGGRRGHGRRKDQ